jgi:hypothetical protein
MYHVCVLQSEVDNSFQSGSAADLEKRLRKAVSVRVRVFCVLILSLMMSGPVSGLEEDDFPKRVGVLPLFLVPRGERPPTVTQLSKLQRHVRVAQRRYREMLSGRDTFEIDEKRPRIVHCNSTLAALKEVDKEQFGNYLVSELLGKFKVNRFNCPYVFLVVIMNPREAWPTAGGRPINLGFNGGGGIAIFSSATLDAEPSRFQSSIQHELGHAFGLPHVDTYGYDQRANKSIMSYSKSNWWTDYTPPKEPGILIPEDIRALTMNKRVFPNLYFDPEQDVPQGYRLCPKMIRLSFDDAIPGQEPYEIKLSTTSGEEGGSKVGNVVCAIVMGNRKVKEGIGLVANNMWMSGKAEAGWIDLQLEFPIAVRMNRIRVHSQCGGGNRPITGIRVEANTGGFIEVARIEKPLGDEEDISFKEVKAKQWRLHFLPGDSKQVVIRGLEFYSSQGEFFCQKFPIHLIRKKK